MATDRPALWQRDGFLAAVLALLTCALFSGVLSLGFLTLDDPAFVTENPVLFEPVSAANLWDIGHTFVGGSWTPLALLSHRLDVFLFGLEPAGHHAMSLALHTASVVILFAFARRFLRRGEAWFIACVFAIHPTRVESVAWIAERRDVLCTLLCLTAVLLWASPKVRASAFGRVAILLVAVAALLAKQIAIVLPFLFLLVDVLLSHPAGSTRRWSLIVDKVPFLAAGACVVGTPVVLQGAGGVVAIATGEAASSSSSFQLQAVLVTPMRYVEAFIAPTHLAYLYPRPPAWSHEEMLAGSIVLLVLCLAVALGNHALRFGCLWFLVAVAPVSGAVEVGGPHVIADRYLYMPSVGLAWAAVGLAQSWPRGAALYRVLVSLWLVWLAFITHAYVPAWSDSGSLAQRAIDVGHPGAMAHKMVGDSIRARARSASDVSEALQHYEASLRFSPNQFAPRLAMAMSLRSLGRWDEACQLFDQLLAEDALSAPVHYGVAGCSWARGDNAAARRHFAAAAHVQPDAAYTRASYARFLFANDDVAGAIAEAEAAFLAERSRANDLFVASVIFFRAGQQARAVKAWQEIVARYPTTVEPWAALAWAGCTGSADDRGRSAVEHHRALVGDDPLTLLLEVCVSWARGPGAAARMHAEAVRARIPQFSSHLDEMELQALGGTLFANRTIESILQRGEGTFAMPNSEATARPLRSE